MWRHFAMQLSRDTNPLDPAGCNHQHQKDKVRQPIFWQMLSTFCNPKLQRKDFALNRILIWLPTILY